MPCCALSDNQLPLNVKNPYTAKRWNYFISWDKYEILSNNKTCLNCRANYSGQTPAPIQSSQTTWSPTSKDRQIQDVQNVPKHLDVFWIDWDINSIPPPNLLSYFFFVLLEAKLFLSFEKGVNFNGLIQNRLDRWEAVLSFNQFNPCKIIYMKSLAKIAGYRSWIVV